jgi:hypothetical protein
VNNGLHTTTSNEISDDSGFFSAGSPDTSPRHAYKDFQLYDSDQDYLDEEASTFPNHGSTYQGSNNSQTSQIAKYTSHGAAATQNYNNSRPGQGSNMVYQSTESGHPSLFGEYREVYATGETQLEKWQVEPWRHERIAIQYPSLPEFSQSRYYDEDIRLTPEPSSPKPRSPKHRKSKSGSSTSRRRHKH